jgi:hypothetical protein
MVLLRPMPPPAVRQLPRETVRSSGLLNPFFGVALSKAASFDFPIRSQFPDQEIIHFEENNCHFLRMSDFPTQENGKN